MITYADFDGYFEIPTSVADNTRALIETYIERYENPYIYKLLGVTLGNLLIEDQAMVSVDERFSVIIEPIYMDDPFNTNTGAQYHSRGMVNYLKAVVFYHFVTENQAFLTQSGVAINENETQKVLTPYEATRFAERKFNEALEDVDTIQWYCDTYAPTLADTDLHYPEYNGQKIKPRFAGVL